MAALIPLPDPRNPNQGLFVVHQGLHLANCKHRAAARARLELTDVNRLGRLAQHG
jgi:hypothetical protein